jgi:hypothetical protein
MSNSYPTELTPPLRQVLGLMCFQCGPIAAVLRRGGYMIKERAEDEQAGVMHHCIHLALQHGDQWQQALGRELKAILEANPIPKNDKTS